MYILIYGILDLIKHDKSNNHKIKFIKGSTYNFGFPRICTTFNVYLQPMKNEVQN